MKTRMFFKEIILSLVLIFSANASAQVAFEVDGIRYFCKSQDSPIVSVVSLNYFVDTYRGEYYSGDIVIPSSVTYESKTYCVTEIASRAFSGCEELTSVEIPNSVTVIGDGAFWICESLSSVNIPDGVTTIGREAFYGCHDLVSVEIPNSVTKIGKYAFRYCI